ncbi:MAG: response regulator [Vicinamibacterales bacterium]
MPQIRVLLVDDNVTFLDAASEFLSHDPRLLVVGTARDGLDAVALIDEFCPDLVLMDLVMPLMNGLDATRRIKALPAPPRVVVVSLLDGAATRRRAEDAGADGFICKFGFTSTVLGVVDTLFTWPFGLPRPAGTS